MPSNSGGKRKGAGRKTSNIDWEKVDTMLAGFSPGTEVAAVLGIHPNTLYENVKSKFGCDFSEYSAKKRALGSDCLRNAQLQNALGFTDPNGDYHPPSNTMQVWLGKQYLKQSDKTEATVDYKPIKIEVSEEQTKKAVSELENNTSI